jgi:hypothetical protein
MTGLSNSRVLNEQGSVLAARRVKALRDQAQTDTMRAQAVLDSAARQPITTTVLRKFAATAESAARNVRSVR